MAALRNRIVLVVLGILVGTLLALTVTAHADGGRHYACYYNPSGTQQTQTLWQYLPNGSLPCGSNWTKIDWVDD